MRGLNSRLLVCWVTLGACGNLSEPQSPPSTRRDTLVTGLKGLKHLIWVHRLELRAQKEKKEGTQIHPAHSNINLAEWKGTL